MKNLTIKKVALGLLLAGYAASGAFAAQTATSAKTIKGNAPVLAKKNASLTAPAAGDINKITVSAPSTNVGGTDTVGVIGDKIVFEFETTDKDGDTAQTPPNATTPGKGSAKNLTVMYGRTNAAGAMVWTDAAASSYSYDAANKVTFTLGSDAGNAEKIGYKIGAETQFGDPDTGGWLSGDKLTSAAPSTGTTDPGDPGTGGTGDGGITGPTTPVPSAGAVFGIFKVNAAGSIVSTAATDNYTNSGSAVLNLGEKFEMVYWDDVDGNGFVNGSEAKYTITGAQWKVFGNNSAAHGSKTSPNSATTAAATDWIIDGQTNKLHLLLILQSQLKVVRRLQQYLVLKLVYKDLDFKLIQLTNKNYLVS